MRNLDSLLIQLQSWAQEEISAQKRVAVVLDELASAVKSGVSEDIVRTGLALEETLETGIGRDVRRKDLMTGLGRYWQVAADSLSLTSVLERAALEGQPTSAIEALRDELREVVLDVTRRAKLLMVVASHHRGVLADLMSILGTSSDNADARRAGVLVDAEG